MTNFDERHGSSPEEVYEETKSSESPELSVGETGGGDDMGFLETVYGVLFEPRTTFKFLGGKKPLTWALIVFCGVFLFNYLVGFGSGAYGANTPGVDKLLSNFTVLFFFVGLAVALAAWFINTAIINLVVQFFGGVGNGIGLLICFGYSQLPLVIVTIATFIFRYVGMGNVVTGLVELAGFIWMVVLQVIAVSEVEDVSTGRAVLIYLIPAVVVIGVLVLLGVMLVAVTAPLLSDFPWGLSPQGGMF